MKKIVVYDFDKTLTYKDTLLGYFLYSGKRNVLYPFKSIIYFFSMILAKLKFMTNTDLKRVGVNLFLSNLEEDVFYKKSKNYHRSIEFNNLFKNLTYSKESEYFIVSASFEEYLKPIFPSFVNIVASKIAVSKNRAVGVEFNCYKENKIEALKKLGVDSIDILYTDSYSDLEMAKISKEIIIVKGDTLIICSNIDEFNRYFIS